MTLARAHNRDTVPLNIKNISSDILFVSLSFCRESRVEGSMSRARVPCRGSRVTFFFQIFFFLEKVIIDAINVIKTNKKNLKNKWRVKIF